MNQLPDETDRCFRPKNFEKKKNDKNPRKTAKQERVYIYWVVNWPPPNVHFPQKQVVHKAFSIKTDLVKTQLQLPPKLTTGTWTRHPKGIRKQHHLPGKQPGCNVSFHQIYTHQKTRCRSSCFQKMGTNPSQTPTFYRKWIFSNIFDRTFIWKGKQIHVAIC